MYSLSRSTAGATTVRERSSSISAVTAFLVSNIDVISLNTFLGAAALPSSTWISMLASYTGCATSAKAAASEVTAQATAATSQRWSSSKCRWAASGASSSSSFAAGRGMAMLLLAGGAPAQRARAIRIGLAGHGWPRYRWHGRRIPYAKRAGGLVFVLESIGRATASD